MVWARHGRFRNRHDHRNHRNRAVVAEGIKTGRIHRTKRWQCPPRRRRSGSKDRITLRGVQRLQEADAVCYDQLPDPECQNTRGATLSASMSEKRPAAILDRKKKYCPSSVPANVGHALRPWPCVQRAALRPRRQDYRRRHRIGRPPNLRFARQSKPVRQLRQNLFPAGQPDQKKSFMYSAHL